MKLLLDILYNFFLENKANVILIICLSFIINAIQANGISYITSQILLYIQKKDQKMVYVFLNYFIMYSIAFTVIFYVYKTVQNNLAINMLPYIKFNLIKTLLLTNNENYNDKTLNKVSVPINRVSRICYLVFTDIITYILPNITFVIVIFCYLFYINMYLGLIFSVGNILTFLYLYLNWADMKNKNITYEKDVNDMETNVLEIFNNIDKIVYRGQVLPEIALYKEKSDQSIVSSTIFFNTANNNTIVMNSILHILCICSLFFITKLYFGKQISATIFITMYSMILIYKDKMLNLIQQIPDLIEFMSRSEIALLKLNGLDDIKMFNQNGDKKYNNAYDLPFHKIQFVNVSYQYNQSANNNVLTDYNLTLYTTNSKIIGITGLSGNGKSTVAKLIIKMYSPTSGDIFIDDVNLQTLPPNYIRENITYINQNSKLFDRKIIDNIFYACNNPDKCGEHLDEIMKYKKVAELYKNIDITNNLAGPLGENLSGGQRQVVNIVSGLINPSKLLILDEPTNALDAKLKKEVLDIIVFFKQYKQCIIIISHDKDCLKLFDENIVV